MRFVNINVASFDAAKHSGAAAGRPTRARRSRRCARRWPTTASTRLERARGRRGARLAARSRGSCAAGHGPRPHQAAVIGAINEPPARPAWSSARPARPGDLHKLWRARDPDGRLPRRVRLLVHGLRDPRRHGRQARRARARRLRPGRRRLLPDDAGRARHRGRRGHRAHRRPRRQPRLRVDRRALALARLGRLRHALPLRAPTAALPLDARRSGPAAPLAASTSPPTPRASARACCARRPSTSCAPRSPRRRRTAGRWSSTSRSTATRACRATRAGGTCRSPRSPTTTPSAPRARSTSARGAAARVPGAMSDLLVRRAQRRPTTARSRRSRRSAGWDYVGFEVLALEPARRAARDRAREVCVVVVAGRVRRASEHGEWGLGGRVGRRSPGRPRPSTSRPARASRSTRARARSRSAGRRADGGAPRAARAGRRVEAETRGHGASSARSIRS